MRQAGNGHWFVTMILRFFLVLALERGIKIPRKAAKSQRALVMTERGRRERRVRVQGGGRASSERRRRAWRASTVCSLATETYGGRERWQEQETQATRTARLERRTAEPPEGPRTDAAGTCRSALLNGQVLPDCQRSSLAGI